MVETVNVPPLDRFQVITEHSKSDFSYDPQYLNISRTDDLVMIQITLNSGRTTELKKALYRRMADLLHQEVGIRKEDVLINLVEVPKENWSFGNGEAQYAT
jgi:phenylpyruvate tautomerase PptA (4-oxalocrotonate tautomerase family)